MMRYPLMGNIGRHINSIRNLQRTFNRQFREAQLRDVWEQVFGPRHED